MADDIETKLSAARTRLILDKPFLGALVLRLPMVKAAPSWCPTIATDARAVYYNAEYIAGLSLEQTQFMLAHEALHCALSHFVRRQHRVQRRWDIACDLAINPLLIRDGLRPPVGSLADMKLEGMTAEEIYPLVEETDQDGPLDQHLYDASAPAASNPDPEPGQESDGAGSSRRDDHEAGGAPQPAPLGVAERDQLAHEWRQRLASAAQQALQAGKLAGAMARIVDQLLQPRLPWRMLLARYLVHTAREDYRYSRPSRREGSAILPTLRSGQVDLVVVLDTSGSVTDAEVREFLTEVDAIKGQVRARVTLHACDAALAPEGPWRYEPWEELVAPRHLRGGGGTRFGPVFQWLERADHRPDVLLYFTDARGEFPAAAPQFPVIWLVKGEAPVPWGSRIQLN
ncbi:MAG: hypothetical protein B7Z66_04270 [Chromatiales bacterium 21-64-14]|nr:MAG: hypothetical protein B7Z66_04270 [Chromatiales bacterium 21-64-14]HQU14706.1 VWA-like domain-containing protein [Gammaproteobacteria bacterium]